MSDLDMAKRSLASMTRRVHTGDAGVASATRAFLVLIDVVDDVGRAFTSSDTSGVRSVVPYMGAAREALETHYLRDGVHPTPVNALSDLKEGAPYAAGALWALSAMSHAWLGEHDSRVEVVREKSGRRAAREAVLELLEKKDLVRPQDALATLKQWGFDVDRATVSRTLGDLLEVGLIEPADPPLHTDRRCRWYQLKGDKPAPPDSALREARSAIDSLFSQLDSHSAREAIQKIIEDVD